MKLLFSICICIFIPQLLFCNINKVFNDIGKESDSMVIKDLTKKKVLYSKDENQKVRPASLTKIMTAMLAIESGKMDKVVTITDEMRKVEPTIANLRVGEKFYLKDLVHAALIKSANDAANSIAIYLGNGDKKKFIAMMNYKAKKIGMKNTNFTNPCGYDIGSHSTTAKDLLALTEYAIKNNTFNKIVKLNKYSFKSINTKRNYTVYTSNKILRDDPYVVGVKTGYTNQAGACLIARAKKGNKDVLMVMLNAHNRWANARKALDSVVN